MPLFWGLAIILILLWSTWALKIDPGGVLSCVVYGTRLTDHPVPPYLCDAGLARYLLELDPADEVSELNPFPTHRRRSAGPSAATPGVGILLGEPPGYPQPP